MNVPVLVDGGFQLRRILEKLEVERALEEWLSIVANAAA